MSAPPAPGRHAAPPAHYSPQQQYLLPPSDALSRIGEQFRELPLADLIPLRSWFADGHWRRGWVGLFLVFAVAPFVLLQATSGDESITRVAWGFAIYFAAAWLIAMHALIRPERQHPWLLARIALFTTVAGVAIAIALEGWLKPNSDSLLQMVVGVGFPEELAKGLAVYLFVFRSRRHLWSTRTFLFAGAVSGIAFGMAEAVTYSVAYADSAASAINASQYTSVAVWRLLTDSLFHGAMAGITAFFIGLAAWHRSRQWMLITVGLVTASVLHGAYDRFASSWGGTAIAALILFVFAGYVRSGDAIAAEYGGSA